MVSPVLEGLYPKPVSMVRSEAQSCSVVRYGQGEHAIVGLHGWSGSHRSFEPLLPYLPESHSLFAFDLPGAGSTHAPPEWTCDAVIDMIEATLDTLGLKRVEVLGVCGGMGFGARLAIREVRRVSRLVLVDPFAYMPWFLSHFTWPVLGEITYWSTFANPMGRWVTDRSLAARRTEETSLTEGFSVRGWAHHRKNLGQLRALADAARKPITELGAFTGPVDLVFGARTFAAVRDSVRILSEIYNEPRVFQLEGAGHMPVHEASAGVAEILFERRERAHAS